MGLNYFAFGVQGLGFRVSGLGSKVPTDKQDRGSKKRGLGFEALREIDASCVWIEWRISCRTFLAVTMASGCYDSRFAALVSPLLRNPHIHYT